ncbi:helix-hairpin-helix domain-containing protein [bacterium]|nr:helix-hairpin-helix domain-containing protein [bacterium]
MKWPFFKTAKPETEPATRPQPSKPRTVFTGVPLRPLSPTPRPGNRSPFGGPMAAKPAAKSAAASIPAPARLVSAAAAPAEESAPAGANGKTIPFGLSSVLSQLPAALLTAQNRSRLDQTTVQIPARLIVPQLSSGKIVLTLADLVPLLPRDLVPEPLTIDPRRHSVNLPLSEVVAAIPPEELATENEPAADLDDEVSQLPDLVDTATLPKRPFQEHPEPAAPAAAETSAEDLAALQKAGAPLQITVSLRQLVAGLPDQALAGPRGELFDNIDPETRVSLPVAPMLSLLGSARPRLPLAVVLKSLPAAVLASPLPELGEQEVPLPLEEIVSQLPPTLFAVENAAPEPLADELNGTSVGAPFQEKTPAPPPPVATTPEPVALPPTVESTPTPAVAEEAPRAKHDTQPMAPWEGEDHQTTSLTGQPHQGRPEVPAFAERPSHETQLLQPMPSDDEIPTPFSEMSPAPPLVEPESPPLPEPTPAAAELPAMPVPTPVEDQLPPEDLELPDLFQERGAAVPAPEPVTEPVAEVPAPAVPEPVAEPVREPVTETPVPEPIVPAEPEPFVAAVPLPAEPVAEPVAETPTLSEPASLVVAEQPAAPIPEPDPVLAAETAPAVPAEPDLDADDFDIDPEQPSAAEDVLVAATADAALEPVAAEATTPFDAEKFLDRINTCSATDLMTVSGIGPALAKRIIDTRTAAGSFRSADDVRRVPGLGARTFQTLCGVSFRALNHLLGVDHETELSLQEMVRLISGMRGVQGCILTAADGLFLTGQLPAHLDQSRLSAFTPELFRKVGLYAQELAVGQVRRMTLFTELHPLSIFQAEDIYVIVIHDTRYFSKALLRRLARISEELARYCRQRAAV